MTSSPIRILMADDSAVIRRLLSQAFTADRELLITGMAVHGGEVLQLLASQRPDIVLLDVEMPVMDGVETVMAIRKVSPTIPIVMFSSITSAGGQATLDALAAGANDYATKPTRQGHAVDALGYIRSELIPKIKQRGRRQQLRATGGTSPVGRPVTPHPPIATNALPKAAMSGMTRSAAPATVNVSVARKPVDIVAIGVSTGGPNALAEVLEAIPADFPVPIVIVQHMPAVFTQLLAARLDTTCSLRVREGVDGAVLQRGDVWIAPGDFHMTVKKRRTDCILEIAHGPLVNSCRPSVDPLFQSIATVYGGYCLGVILTGMGRDGEDGSRAICDAGGQVIAQDEASSVVWGMPRAVTRAGLASAVLPLPQIAREIVDRTRRMSTPLMAPVRSR